MVQKIELNPLQQQSVNHTDGPLLIVAGAGTGKTRVITEKIKYFIEQGLAKPEEILALTFTDKAAGEMVERVDEAMPLGYQEPWISTFHSFCDRILRKEGLDIGLDPSYKITTPTEGWILIRQHLFDFDLDYYRPLGNPTKFISSLLTLFSRAQDEAITAEEYLSFANKNYELKIKNYEKNTNGQLLVASCSDEEILEAKRQLELAQAYDKYQNLKIAESKLDFGDLISWTLKLFRERPNILKKYQDRFKLIMIDEFQDTNYAQYQLIKLLAPANRNPLLVVVGDDDQSIYKWRGASITNVMYFKQDYPQAKIITLTDNYRSVPDILNASYGFIQYNPKRLETELNISKKLTPHYQPRSQPSVGVHELATQEEEADYVTNLLIMYNNQGYSWQEMAILARANNHLEPFTASLKRNQIPYQLVGNRGLFEQEEIRYLVAFLKTAADTGDNLALFQLFHTPAFDINRKQILDLMRKRKQEKTTLWQVVIKQEGESIHEVQQLIEEGQKIITTTPPSTLLLNFIKESSYHQPYIQEETLENQLKLKNIARFFDIIKRFETETNQDPLNIPNTLEFINYLELLQEAGENPAQAEIEDVDTVSLMTVHAAKGLEFKVVVIPCLIRNRFPTRNRSEKLELPEELVAHREVGEQTHIEEERRLFYVACTRAQEQLILTYAKNYGGKRETKPSPFLSEMFPESVPITSYELPVTNYEQLNLTTIPIPQVPRKPPMHELTTVSYTQLETFKTCPLKYKYAYVLRLPTPPSVALNFGQTLHRTLRDFHRATFFGQQPDLEKLLKIYYRQWLPGGYDSPKHQQAFYQRGEDILKNYHQQHQEHLAPPTFLEQKFTLRFGPVKLVGSIDRIGKSKEGVVEIVDYKTGGSNKTKDELQKEAEKSEQLTIYALAAQEALRIKPNQLSLYFLEHGYNASTTRSDEQLSKMREGITQRIEDIKSSLFQATPGFHCKWCSYSQICTEARLNL